jgi:hypothetical protein
MSSSSVCRHGATKKSPVRPRSAEREIGYDGFPIPTSRAPQLEFEAGMTISRRSLPFS